MEAWGRTLGKIVCHHEWCLMEAPPNPSSDEQSCRILGAVALLRLLQCVICAWDLEMLITASSSLSKAPQGYSYGTQHSSSSSSREVLLLLNFSVRDLCVTCAQLVLGLEVTQHHCISPTQCFRCLWVWFWICLDVFYCGKLCFVFNPPKHVSAQYDLRL